MQRDGLFQPYLSIIEPVGKQCDAAQLEDGLIVFGILSGDLRVDFAGFGKLPILEKQIGGIYASSLGLSCRLVGTAARHKDHGKSDANPGKRHLDLRHQR